MAGPGQAACPINRPRHLWFLAAALLWIVPAGAAPVTLNGITFSDELGGVVLHGGTGIGSPDDPFVLVEEINDDGPAVLVVQGLGGVVGGRARTGFSLVKVVTNRTGRDWHVFELELREQLERPSSYEDGLSFGQATPQDRPIGADRFGTARRVDEPLDAIEFSDGLVRPGETVRVEVQITDFTPDEAFYLLQQRQGPVARGIVPGPGTLSSL